MRGLLIYPTHENCDEVTTEAAKLGLNAAVYPARCTDESKGANCWNLVADEAERIGFPVVKTVCPTCNERLRCAKSGYLKQLGDVKDATVAACTHKRAEYSGLQELCSTRPYVSIHENAISILRPKCECSKPDLMQIQELFRQLLENPRYLDWFGDDLKVDDDGVLYHDEELAIRKERLRVFCVHVADIVDDLLRCLESAEQITEWVIPAGQARPQGIERLCFATSRHLQIRFEGQPWRFILTAAAGELQSAAVVVYERKSKDATKHPKSTIKTFLGFRQNSPPTTCVTWFNDATISADALSAVLDQSVLDKTPQGRIELQKKAVQILRDITRQTSTQSVLSILRGVLSKRAINDREPVPPPGVPECPEFLDAEARAEWFRTASVLKEMGLLTKADRSALAAYCVVYSRWVHAEAQVKKFGSIVKSPEKGFPMKSPYLTIADQSLEAMRKLMVEFGLTPSSRSRIRVPEDSDARNELELFLGAS